MNRGFRILGLAAFCLIYMPVMGYDNFEVAVTNALSRRSRLVDPAFTNYLAQCINQHTNQQMALTAMIIQGLSQVEMYLMTMDENCISNAFSSISNAQLSAEIGIWPYWHLQALNVLCMNTDNNHHGAYAAASNTWRQVMSTGFVDSTNIISRALLRFYDMGDGASIKDAMAVMYALDAYMLGKTNEVDSLKQSMSNSVRQKFESFVE